MEPAIILDLLILLGIVSLWVFIWIERGRKKDSFGQLDEAFGRVAVELLERTKHLPDLADLMPNISLVNDPLGGAIRAIWDKIMGATPTEDNFTGFTQPAPADDERRMMMYGERNESSERKPVETVEGISSESASEDITN
jgi:hypothetical protein